MAAHVELRFVRLNAWPAGMRFDVLWNGVIDESNGDGKPNPDPDADVDQDNPLTLQSVEVWPVGKAGDGAGRDGEGIDGFAQSCWPGYGDGRGIDGLGEDGLYNDWLTWNSRSVLPALRDGRYKFAVRFEDEFGTRQTEPLEVASILVRGVPRPPRNLRFVQWDADAGRLCLAWDHSFDLMS